MTDRKVDVIYRRAILGWHLYIDVAHHMILVALFRKDLNKKIEVQRPNLSQFKVFGMMNLNYEVRICQKIYNRVTITVSICTRILKYRV